MRILADIPDDDLQLLNRMSALEGVSRAELVRRAVAAALEAHRVAERVDAFGLWGDAPVDGLAYQDRVRSEW